MATNNKNFKVKNGLEVTGNISVSGNGALQRQISVLNTDSGGWVTSGVQSGAGSVYFVATNSNTNLIGGLAVPNSSMGVVGSRDMYVGTSGLYGLFLATNGATRLSFDSLGTATFAKTVIFPAATTTLAPLRIPHGTAPSAPTNGDIWTTTDGVYARINGTTVGPLGAGGGAGVTVSATAPVSPSEGDLWFDTDTGITSIYYDSTWVEVGGGGAATGGGTDQAFYENDATITTDYTVTAGRNAMSAGPMTINSGVTVQVPSNSTWTIV